jgi:hypothetical protein
MLQLGGDIIPGSSGHNDPYLDGWGYKVTLMILTAEVSNSRPMVLWLAPSLSLKYLKEHLELTLSQVFYIAAVCPINWSILSSLVPRLSWKERNNFLDCHRGANIISPLRYHQVRKPIGAPCHVPLPCPVIMQHDRKAELVTENSADVPRDACRHFGENFFGQSLIWIHSLCRVMTSWGNQGFIYARSLGAKPWLRYYARFGGVHHDTPPNHAIQRRSEGAQSGRP